MKSLFPINARAKKKMTWMGKVNKHEAYGEIQWRLEDPYRWVLGNYPFFGENEVAKMEWYGGKITDSYFS